MSQSVSNLVDVCRKAPLNPNYKEDFIKTLNEIAICFQYDCYIATIALCGKLLEVCLREILIRNKVEADENLMLGKLISKVKTEVSTEYIDPSLEHLANVISKSRNTAIHYKERIPIPSRDQAIMVIFATREVITRNLSHYDYQ